MKCKSVACIWSRSPPVHRITAVAALDQPPTLYTGGSDGSIIWWNLTASHGKPVVKPVAMLCGHAAPVADLGICLPVDGSESGNLTKSSNLLSNPNSVNYCALISACTDGVLCVWSRAGGHCRRRRKIPPWAGSPFMIRSLPGNMRYVCITCCVNKECRISNSVEGDEHSVDGELYRVNPSKCTVVIVGSYSLTIVQTVLHENISMGPLKSMAVALPPEDKDKHSVMIIDSFGKVLNLSIEKNSDPKGKNVPGVTNGSSILEVVDCADDSKDNASLVAFAKCGHLLSFVHKTHCTFRRTDNAKFSGQISFSEDLLFVEEKYVIGGVFLGDDPTTMKNGSMVDFVAWNNRGSAVIYRISYSTDTFDLYRLSTIPALLHLSDSRMSFSFIPVDKYLLRVESVCFRLKEHSLWKPHVTVWRLPLPNDNYSKLCLECDMLGEGNFFDDWPMDFSLSGADGPMPGLQEEDTVLTHKMTQWQNIAVSPDDACVKCSSSRRYDTFYQGPQLVSSSMVISENYLAPFAIVYGYFSGDIEVVSFHAFFTALDSLSPHKDAHSNGQKHYLTGHTGAVLCLASHQMVRGSGRCSFNHVLLSGSMDCTVRVWDLDSGSPITVLHQHVAPVRQIILPPRQSEYPWSDCFLTVGNDSCLSLTSLQTLRVERLFPGHLYVPAKVVWDGVRGYIACLCPNNSEMTDALDILYIWDVKTGARERVLRGAAAHSMFDHFLSVVNESFSSGSLTNGNTSASSLTFPATEGTKSSQSLSKSSGNGIPVQTSAGTSIEKNVLGTSYNMKGISAPSGWPSSVVFQSEKYPIKSSCPLPGVSTLCFDLTSLMSLCSKNELFEDGSLREQDDVKGNETHTSKDEAHQSENASLKEPEADIGNEKSCSSSDVSPVVTLDPHEWIRLLEGCLLEFSLSFLHLWNIDADLDNLLTAEMNLKRPECFIVSSGILGDRGSVTLTFPGSSSILELWRSSSEYSALRSLTMVALAQHLISLSHSCSSANSALAAFYTRKFAEKIADIKPPCLQLLVSFWQNEFEHVKMAARSLFHCAASRAIPLPLCRPKAEQQVNLLIYPKGVPEEHENSTAVGQMSDEGGETQGYFLEDESEITSWLDSYEGQGWISCVGGTTQDAMTFQIIVAAALAVWYTSRVKLRLAMVVVHPLVKLTMSMNEKCSAVAAEILAEGMESIWKAHISHEIPRLIGDIFFQVECVNGTSASASALKSAASLNVQETLVGILLPSLAMADIPGFLHVIESQIWSTASDSPVHVISLMTLIRVVRGSPRNLAPYLDKVVTFILQTMDPGNLTMCRSCRQSSMTALKEVVRVYPMIALNDTSTRLAVGDAIGDIKNANIRVYDMQSMNKIKVLDASGPPGLPSFLGGTSTTAISALSFSPDGEGLVAFSENGLLIRWWSLGTVWWEKLSRNLIPVQCTKLIFVPPWEGFSPNSARSSIMASVLHDDGLANSPGSSKSLNEMERLKLLIHNFDLSYRLEWVGERKVMLTQHSHELGTFQL